VAIELNNALGAWTTTTKSQKNVLHINVVTMTLQGALQKNPWVVRDFEHDIKRLQGALGTLTKTFTLLDGAWKREAAAEKDPKTKAAKEAYSDKARNCLHAILETLAKQIWAGQQLRTHLNTALANIRKSGDAFVNSSDNDLERTKKTLENAIKQYDALTTKSQNWHGPTVKYWSNSQLEVIGGLGELAFNLSGARLKKQANMVDRDTRDMKDMLKHLVVHV